MTEKYIPSWMTIEQAAAWLIKRVGGEWDLVRLLNYGAQASIWIRYSPDQPEIFGDRSEGFIAPILFAGDTQHLRFTGGNPVLTMTRLPDGRLVRFTPGVQFERADIRFSREEIVRIAGRDEFRGAVGESPADPS